jgi:thioesterase domain-containing protein
LIAYEMAQQLEAAGETVACLAIMDTPAPSVQLTNPLSAILHLGVKTLLPALSAYCIDYLRLWRQQQAGLPLPALHRLLRVTLANTRASRQVHLQPYSGRVTLLRSAQDFGALGQHPDLGWGAFARGGVEVVSVPGDHMTLLRQPHVPIVAERLRACLVKAGQPSLSNNVVKTKEHA